MLKKIYRIFNENRYDARMQLIEKAIVTSVRCRGRGWVFTPRHFAALGDPRVIGMALTRLSRKGTIRRLARGLYDYPRQHPQLGMLAPSPDTIACALTGRDATHIQPSGAYAANRLGLSEQVPMRLVFLTDGPSRRVMVGKQEIRLKRTTLRNMATAGTTAGLIIQALKYLGRRQVDESTLQRIRERLTDEERERLLPQVPYAPAWIGAILRQLATKEPN